MNKLVKIPCIVILIISVCCFTNCNKKSKVIEKNVDITKTNDVSLMTNMTLAKMGLNDTVNNIKGMLIFVRNVQKKEENLNLNPTIEFMTDDLRKFAQRLKTVENQNKQDTNYYTLAVKSVYEQDNIISVLFDKKTHISGTKDTVHELITYNYDKETEEVYTFCNVFKVNASNLERFNELFQSSFKLEDLSSLSFNFEKDLIWLNISKNKTTQRFGQRKNRIKNFLFDDKKK
ncbi:MAG: hypothetical protein ACTTJH_03540 [Bacteroidales bacterium]